MSRIACVFLLFSLLSIAVIAQGPKPSETISAKIGTLRSLGDAERAKVTMQLALDIRALPAGKEKVQLASGLTNLSTEGDFGKDTLQAVTDTLVQAIKESPAQDENGQPNFAYAQLAQLARFEHMTVKLADPKYLAAMAELGKVEAARKTADFTLQDITGKSWTRASLKGKVVLVNFWATWCPPCRKEMPDLEALYNEFKGKGLVILAISDETLDKVKPFIADHKYTFPVLLDPGRKTNDVYKVDGIPKSFVYNREGKLVAQSIDMRTRGQFLKMLAEAGLK
jgi:peroxiredoxin